MNMEAFIRGFLVSGGWVLILVLLCGIIGAVVCITSLTKGITRKQTAAIVLSSVGLGLIVIGILLAPMILFPAGLVCGLIARSMAKKLPPMTYEEFKRQKALMEDPDYLEYIEATGGSVGLPKAPVADSPNVTDTRYAVANPLVGLSQVEFSRLRMKAKRGQLTPEEQSLYSSYIEASAMKHDGKVKEPMSDGKLGAIVLGVLILILLLSGIFSSLPSDGSFDFFGGGNGGHQTIHDLGGGTILINE